MAYTYDADDRLGSDQYDANVNTTSSFGVASAYDFENHMVQKGAVTIVYDGDGNRVSETVGWRDHKLPGRYAEPDGLRAGC